VTVTNAAIPLALLAAFAAACSSGSRLPVDVPPPRLATAEEDVATLVGTLLGPSAEASLRAEKSLLALPSDRDAAILAHARRIPHERDPRWLHVLDERGLLDASPAPLDPPLSASERLDLVLWKAARGDRALLLKAQSRLLEIARSDPGSLEERLRRPGPARDVVAVALANADDRAAVPALLALYRTATSREERRAAATAIGRLAGEEVRPRASGPDEELERDAQRVDAWIRAHPAPARDAGGGESTGGSS
jgi:hypothetical protein